MRNCGDKSADLDDSNLPLHLHLYIGVLVTLHDGFLTVKREKRLQSTKVTNIGNLSIKIILLQLKIKSPFPANHGVHWPTPLRLRGPQYSAEVDRQLFNPNDGVLACRYLNDRGLMSDPSIG